MELVWKENYYFFKCMLQYPNANVIHNPTQDQKTVLATEALFFNPETKNVYNENQKCKNKQTNKKTEFMS